VARRTGLREFQLSVAERLRSAATRTSLSSKLGFQVAGANWLVDLHLVSEVVPVPASVSVPLARPWFCGVANVRGKLYGIVDFSAFQGGEATPGGSERRLVLVSDRLVIGAGLLVSRMLGLRSPENFAAVERGADEMPWVGAVFRDPTGAIWRELDLARLAADRRFLDVGIH
jgi:twitching motility protein PilI